MTTEQQAAAPVQQRVGVWLVTWRNPNKTLPEGFPAVILRIEMVLAKGQGAGVCPPEIRECWEEMAPYGYGVSWHLEAPPARKLPIQSKQRIRRRNLWKRLLAKVPMFLEKFYQEAIAAKPDYYGDYTPGEFADVQFAQTTMKSLKMVNR